jgi:hypothetical protein
MGWEEVGLIVISGLSGLFLVVRGKYAKLAKLVSFVFSIFVGFYMSYVLLDFPRYQFETAIGLSILWSLFGLFLYIRRRAEEKAWKFFSSRLKKKDK